MERRRFSAALQGQNLRFTGAGEGGSARAWVGFLLLEHFSLPAFTQALDTLVTANLIRSESFAVSNFSLSGEPVTSDLGLLICRTWRSPRRRGKDSTCWWSAAVCVRPALVRRAAGSVAGRGVARRRPGRAVERCLVPRRRRPAGWLPLLHPSRAPRRPRRDRPQQPGDQRQLHGRPRPPDRGQPTGAFNLALEWIARRHGRDLVEAVVDILAFEESRYRRVRPALHEKMSEPLREVINLMAANIEEPLSQEQLAHYVGRSRRQIERLFQQQLGTTPVRYYLELRITECRRLLQHSDLTMLEVLVACGFVSPSHFSKCYTAFYGYPPSKEVRYGNVRSTK
ncbi:putative transcriptional regulator [Pseudomonas aeruginosa]|nr:putative transcriptional regulator [Pseudomonas aeruginosa]